MSLLSPRLPDCIVPQYTSGFSLEVFARLGELFMILLSVR